MLHQKRNRALTLAVLALGFCGASAALAAVTPGGDTTTGMGTSYIGKNGVGTLGIDGGSVFNNSDSYIGYNTGSSGIATVSGAGSKWNTQPGLYVGYNGSGKLIVEDGGLVTTWTIHASPSDLYGNGTISARGAVLDADLVIDSAHGTTQTLPFGSGGTLNLAIGADLGAGYKGSGSLRITDGLDVSSSDGYLGYQCAFREPHPLDVRPR